MRAFQSKAVILTLGALVLFVAGCGDGDTTTIVNNEIPPIVQIKTPHISDMLLASTFALTLDVAGGSGTYDWSITTGGLNDAWLSLDPSTGDLTGTPDTLGRVELYIHVEDTEDATKYDNAYYEFYIYAESFPGTPVSENNLALDGMAFSPSSVDVGMGGGMPFFLFTNHANGTGIFLAKMEEEDPAVRFSLWASYFDGTAMTPMVQIKGELYDPAHDFNFEQVRVAFINDTGQARDGDALILFTWREIDTTSTSDLRLYSSYFDVTEAVNAISTTNADVRYGFDTHGDLVSDDDNGFEVEGTGVMTDGMYLISPSFADEFTFFLNGNQVSYLAAVWTEMDATGGTLYTANFDLTSANTDNTFDAASAMNPDTTMDANDQVQKRFMVCGKTIFYVVELDGEPLGLDHRILEAATWNSTTGVLYLNAALSRVDANDVVTASLPEDVLGSIQGLDRAYAVGQEKGYNDDLGNQDDDVMLYIYNPADGTSEVWEIDNNTGVNTVGARNIELALNRTGEIIWIGWRQAFSLVDPNTCLFMQAVQTIPAGGATRTLANAILSGPQLMNSDYQDNTNAPHVDYFAFDGEVMQTFGNSSDSLRCNTIFLQRPDATDYDNYQLRTAYLKITLDITGTAAPTADAGSGSAGDTLIWENDENHPFWDNLPSDGMDNFRCLDSGTTGAPIVYFVGDGDGTPLVETVGEAHEARLFVWDGREATPTTTEISGDGTDTGIATYGFSNSRQMKIFAGSDSAFQVMSTAVTPYDGTNPDVSANYHNVIFISERDVPGSTDALRHRCLDLASTAATIQLQFSPNLTAQPFTVDCDMPGSIYISLGDGPSCSNGDTIAVYFKHGAHLWYNEFTGGTGNTWIMENGLSTPQLVDNLYPEEVIGWNNFTIAPFTIGTWDLISNMPIFYIKWMNLVGENKFRIFCRIHD